MNEDAINHWIDRAKINESIPKQPSGVQVIKNKVTKSRGQIIMELADYMLPHIQKILLGQRNRDGMVLQPAHIRGIALNYAEHYVKTVADAEHAA